MISQADNVILAVNLDGKDTLVVMNAPKGTMVSSVVTLVASIVLSPSAVIM